MKDNIIHKKFANQMGKKMQLWVKIKLNSVNMNKSPRQIHTCVLLSTSPILKLLSFDDIQPNKMIQLI